MTTTSLTLREDQLEQLARHLLRPDGNEHAAYLLCHQAKVVVDPWDREAHLKLLVSNVIPVSDDQVIQSTPSLISWSTASFVRALKLAADTKQIVAVVHNHPASMLDFSPQDDLNEPDLLQIAQNRNEGAKIVSLIMTPDRRLAGRIWHHPTQRGHDPIRMIRVIGDRFTLHYPGRGQDAPLPTFNRQALAFGQALNNDLRHMRIGIVGCGGTGSAAAMLLARLGVGHLVLIDNDIVDQTNLNRLHFSHQSHADRMRPKVEVVADGVAACGLGTRVVAIESWVGDPACRDALRSCDVIFGCTDDNEGRMFLNRFAYYYTTPVIDIGLAVDISHGDEPVVNALDGRVTVIMPHNTCLLCREVVSATAAEIEKLRRLHPAEYRQRKAEAYVQGEGNPSPAVVTFTTELACMAANELIHRLQGFRGPSGAAANRVRKFHLGEDRKTGKQPQEGCDLCSHSLLWSQGDVEPFLDRGAP